MYLSLYRFLFCFILISRSTSGSIQKERDTYIFLHSRIGNACLRCIMYYTPLYLHVSRYIIIFSFFSIRHNKISDDEKKRYSLLSSVPRTDSSIRITLQVPTARINLLSNATKSYIIEKYHQEIPLLYYQFLVLPSVNRNTHFQSISHRVQLLYMCIFIYIYIQRAVDSAQLSICLSNLT